MQYSDVLKGALLHDIGKFVMRASGASGMNHQEIGEKWLKDNGLSYNISVFAARHHYVPKNKPKYEMLDVFAMPTNELLMVYEADNLSSGERPQKEGKGDWQKDAPLMSVFSKISLSHRSGKDAYKNCWSYYRLGTAGESLKFPGDYTETVNSYKSDGYGKLLSSFEADFEILKPNPTVDELMVLLEKYTSYIPAETRVVKEKPESYPDVSLFDHLKTTTAITACLYKYFEETRPDLREVLLKEEILDRQDCRYILVGGDFSGVQKFIYTISSKGALKTLRARSFFLELLTEHVITEILNRMGLPRTNIIYSGGGRFYLLAPNTPVCRGILEEVSWQINNYLFSSYHGELYLALEKVKFAGDAFIPDTGSGSDIAELWEELRKRLNIKKSRKFLEQIEEDSDNFWTPANPAKKTCAVCHSDTSAPIPLRKVEEGDEPIEVCSLCKHLFELGDELPHTKYIVACQDKPQGVDSLQIEDTYYALCSSEDQLKSLNAETTYVINSWSMEDYLLPGAVQLFTGNYTARQDRSYKGFDQMAREAAGADKIGILRMDVDNLGQIFTRGLPERGRTFSRLSTLSRSLTHFFKYHINDICSDQVSNFDSLRLYPTKGGRNVTVVYAGGDDLFLVGSWDQVTETAFDVNQCFREFTGRNPDITISGGVVVQDPKYPLYKLAELAGDAEEKAKDNGKDSIALFYVPAPDFTHDEKPLFTGIFKWDEADGLLKQILLPAAKDLSEIKDSPKQLKFDFSKSFMHRLGAVADIWRREGKLYLPRLAYVLAREGERLERSLSGHRKQVWLEFKQSVYDLNYLSSLKTAVIWMDLLSRRGAEEWLE
jgi:CRISPR-associated protein Csm1